jgi:hypothetical protein
VSSESKRLVLVGHCVPDSFMLTSALGRVSPGLEIERANDLQSAIRASQTSDLLLVNRVLDGEFASSDGIALIRSLAGAKARLMLVSNLEDAQAQAREAGAMPGFGKAAAYQESTREVVRAALDVAP